MLGVSAFNGNLPSKIRFQSFLCDMFYVLCKDECKRSKSLCGVTRERRKLSNIRYANFYFYQILVFIFFIFVNGCSAQQRGYKMVVGKYKKNKQYGENINGRRPTTIIRETRRRRCPKPRPGPIQRMLPFEQFLITRAMRDIERKSCVKFVPRKDEYDYVKIIFDSYKCYSNVGRRGGEQVLSLGIFCVMFYDRGNVYHELFHVLGFHHEHNRPDRDDHVDVMWRNIRREARNNFEKRHPNSVDLLSMPYDIEEIRAGGSHGLKG
ncbi:Zinc metalloproteinase nas-39 [Armadillidium vulgare]|nr:Zinc metalloproteinase nas-39 [Armadillidium vulgare]